MVSSALCVARLVRTQLGASQYPPLVRFEEALGSQKWKRLLLFEDALLTGDECIKSIKEFEKVGALREGIELSFRHAVATRYGMLRVSAFLQQLSFKSVRICDPGEWIENISDSGELERNVGLFDTNLRLRDPRFIRCGLNAIGRDVVPAADREKANRFCEAIGEQLMRDRFRLLPNQNAIDFEGKVEETRLGWHNLGLMLGFVHGIPDATLSLFRLGGTVEIDGRQVPWKPLFPAAARKL